MSFLPDFGKIAETATNIDAGLDRIDGRLTEIVEQLQINNGLVALLIVSRGTLDLSISPDEREIIDVTIAKAFGERRKIPFSPTGINGDDDATPLSSS